MKLYPLLTTLVLASTPLALHHAPRTAPRKACGGGGHHHHTNATGSISSITAETIKAIMPLSASCADRGAECTNASVAAPHLAASLDQYGVASAYERAGVLALIAYKSVELQYRTNQKAEQKAEGPGTANEQGGEFNVQYANTFPELASLNLTTSNVLAQATQDRYNFATQATAECHNARAAAKQSNTTAWQWFSTVYLYDCVGVDITAQTGRTEYWNNALAAFGIINDTTNGGTPTTI